MHIRVRFFFFSVFSIFGSEVRLDNIGPECERCRDSASGTDFIETCNFHRTLVLYSSKILSVSDAQICHTQCVSKAPQHVHH